MSAIQLNDVWKRYYIEYNRRILLREAFFNFLKGNPKSEFWALKNISLEVKKGETLGIIGRNGSGKTTLLKLICGVTKATKGLVKVNGKIAGLLELGAGFQGDLTGRENIYLTGSILGFSQKDIQSNVDSIIDFADLGDFIDAPLRIYSTGMYLRLGFAIATSLNTDILLIDEVLAVGDQAFQDKCLRKIREFKKEGRSIVLVSHNLNMVRELCERVILIDKGSIICDGDPKAAMNRYNMSIAYKEEARCPTLEIEIMRVYFKDDNGEAIDTFKAGEGMKIIIEYSVYKKIESPVFGIGIYRDNIYIAGPNTRDAGYQIDYVTNKGVLEYRIKQIPFSQGRYKVSVSVHSADETRVYDHHECLYEFQVVPGKKEFNGLISIGNAVWNSRSD